MFPIVNPTSCIQTPACCKWIIRHNAIRMRSPFLDFVWKKGSPVKDLLSQSFTGWDSDPGVLLYFTCACQLFAKKEKKRKKKLLLLSTLASYSISRFPFSSGLRLCSPVCILATHLLTTLHPVYCLCSIAVDKVICDTERLCHLS